QWSSYRVFCHTEYTRRSAGILNAGQLTPVPSKPGARTGGENAADLEQAMAARQKMLARPDFIDWLPTVQSDRTFDVEAGNSWLARAKDLRARILAVPGVKERVSAP